MKYFLPLLLTTFFSCTKPESDEKIIDRKIKGFINWYSMNLDSLSINLVNPIVENSELSRGDSTKPYTINFEKAETYLKVFLQSGFVSEVYAEDFRDYFRKCQAEFELNPIYMGPPSGLDFDFIFRTQEYDFLVDNVEKAQVLSIEIEASKAKASLRFDDTYIYDYKLSKVNGDWLIDSIKATWEK